VLERRVSPRFGPQHLLSASRVLLGALVLSELTRAQSSSLVLPAVVLACLSDWYDGRVARRRMEDSLAGRLVDNLSDAAFLGLAFTGFALATTWSHPLTGSAVRYTPHANWLPVAALALSFGSYSGRWLITARKGKNMLRSERGHAAGVANYVLALLGGLAVLPGVQVTRWLLEPAFVTVALMNATAAVDNVGLLLRARVLGR